MITLTKNDEISIFGNLKIIKNSNRKPKNICISIEKSKLHNWGNILYDILEKEYKNTNYECMNDNAKLKTTKVIINNEKIKNNAIINIYGKVIDRGGIPCDYGKEYEFAISNIYLEDLFKRIKTLYDDYICDFDTVKEGLEFVFEKMEIEV